MSKHQDMVKQFMTAFGQATPGTFSPDEFPAKLRVSLIMEEALEFNDAVENEDFVEAVDAICDLLYVTYGAAIAMGINIDPFFEEVHRSNMSKLDPATGQPIYRDDGKIIKPSSYSRADIKTLMLKLYGLQLIAKKPE
jgi:predicted HAD superfamily Cof-like phosphohydrolase